MGQIALLADYDDRFEKALFFQAAASAYGLQVRAFIDPALAVAWLKL